MDRQKGAANLAVIIALVVLVVIGGYFQYLKTHRSPAPTPAPGVSGSGIMGRVMVGPTCPVVREGDTSCDDRPYQGDFIVKDATTLRVVSRFSTNLYGYFSVSLDPGTYRIESVQRIGISQQSHTVIVRSGVITQVTLTFDTGIR